ncbi:MULTISPECIES: YkgJ family cysteine cluster protein [unclassified Acinetobacter]|uniref:YkgJ family cysteine cluster protein n=1 Tax=unclassified Acinetobacter TaxID=196816 RepID=UPI0029344B54|nr:MULTISPECIES: YkgJ family cysteine cluster protein [unclassified Acinetobacter]WOE30967.1 YkgJ family cysteine cluster protein [Acinetobacter sp. SAAs470]WOE39163.1 YkgJ family cysteine cluster protein [Acinetobacter sp. SAAs474]
MLSQLPTSDACLNCGACCAFFRVSFYWAEGLNIPEHYTEPVNSLYSCMVGTNQKNPRCSALSGIVGQAVSCDIYTQRSSSCQEVRAGDQQCNKARRAYQMIPLISIDVIPPSNDEDYERVG